MIELQDIRVVLLDIEGTVCPISFVKDVLFPYALKTLPQTAERNWDDETFRQYVSAFPEEHRSSPAALVSHVQDLTARDVKIAYLKDLQGYLWRTGYESGEIVSPLFEDVVPRLKKWKDEAVKLAIFSSGSVPAQKLLFAHVGTGNEENKTQDLTSWFAGYFDTVNAGPKGEKSSYGKIASELGTDEKNILFLSDNVQEVGAAIEAGMHSVVVDRPGNATLTPEEEDEFLIIQSLDEVDLVKQVSTG